MASIIVLLILTGCAVFQFLKGTFLKAFVTFMAGLCASIVAFGWFEQLAGLLIQRQTLVGWAQTLCLVVLFVLTFAILQSIAITVLQKTTFNLGLNAERAGRIIFGLLLGLVISGLLLIAIALMPLPGGFPYKRFDAAKPDIDNPSKPLPGADGFIAGCFKIFSKGSLNGSRSFAVLHSGFLDQIFLNRLAFNKKISVLAEPGSITMPDKAAVWPVTGSISSSKPDYELMIARIGFTPKLLKSGGSFSLGQLRLICKKKGDVPRLEGSARDVYPVGYLGSSNRLQTKPLSEQIKLQQQDIKDTAAWIDFAFYVPADFEPVAVGFMSNVLAEAPPPVPSDQAPKPIPFMQSADCETEFAKVVPATSATIYGLELASEAKLLQGISLVIPNKDAFTAMQTEQSLMSAKFVADKISCTQAELKIQPVSGANQGENKLAQLLRPTSGYALASLKCNNPAVGSAIQGNQLPCLIDSTGTIHRPCGLIAGGKVNEETVFELDFCTSQGDIIFAQDGSVSNPFPDRVWITEQAQSISDFYVIFMVKTDTVILSVQQAEGKADAALDGADCFLAK